MKAAESNKKKVGTRKLPCRSCDGDTFHKVMHSVHRYEDYEDISVWEDYEIVACQGCKEISFHKSRACSEDWGEDPVTHEIFIVPKSDVYPNRLSGRKPIKDKWHLPQIVGTIYEETHAALCGKLNVLAGVGIRSLVEAICKEKKANGRNLEQKINDLVTQGVLTQANAQSLHFTRLLGNLSAHEMTPSNTEELDIAMDIVENLLNTVYIIPEKTKRL